MGIGSSTLIDVQHVTKTFDTLEGPLPVLDDVSLQVRQGEIGRASCRERVSSVV